MGILTDRITPIFIFLCTSLCLISPAGFAQYGGSAGDPNQRGMRYNDQRQDPFGPMVDTTQITNKRKILDDSTKQIYGAYTSKYYLERQVYTGDTTYHIPDTALTEIQRYDPVMKEGFKMQDLGNTATPIKRMFYQHTGRLGFTSGFDNLDPYVKQISDVRYFSAYSPFSYWNLFLGRRDRSLLEVGFNRSVNDNAGIGAEFRSFTGPYLVGTDKVGNVLKMGRHQSFLVKGHYQTPDKRYKVLGHFYTYQHQLKETGGLFVDSTITDIQQLYQVETQQIRNNLNLDANGEQRGLRLHIFQQFELINRTGLTLFHSYTREQRYNFYKDRDVSGNSDFYPNIYYNDGQNLTVHSLELQSNDNKIGLKVRRGPLFIAGYMKHKNYSGRWSQQHQFNTPIQPDDEIYAGGTALWNITDTSFLEVDGEMLLFDQYRLKATYFNKLIKASFESYFSAPAYTMQFHRSNHFRWANNFANTRFDRIEGALNITSRNKKFAFLPYGSLNTLTDYLYYGQDAMPRQFSGTFTYLQLGSKLGFDFGNIHQIADLTFTESGNDDVMRLPNLMANYQIYWQRDGFKKAIFFQMGFDIQWFSSYKADAYMPVTQQFHLQDTYSIGNYTNIDYFFNFNMINARIFFKFVNLTHLFNSRGTFTTPVYMSRPCGLEFGLSWYFYD